MTLPVFQVYSRPGCHLCEVLIEALLPLIRGRADVDVLDIDSRPEWIEKYGVRIPVVEFEGRFVCQYHLDADEVSAALSRVEAGYCPPSGD